MSENENVVDFGEASEREHTGLVGELALGGQRAEQAMKKLFQAYESRVARYLYKFGLTRHEAEDLWHDVLVSIWRSAAQFRGETSVKNWIFKLAHNRVLDLLNLSSRKQEHLSEVRQDPDDPESAVDLVDTLFAAPTGPSDLDRCVRRAYARFALAHPEKAEWIAKANVLEFEIPEIAAQMDRSLDATRQYLTKVRKAMQEFFKDCHELLKP